MHPGDLLRIVKRVIRALNHSALDYMITGALASSYCGHPRTTLDIDVVVAVRRKDLARLAKELRSVGLKARERILLAALQGGCRIATIEDGKSAHTLEITLVDEELERNDGCVLGVPTIKTRGH